MNAPRPRCWKCRAVLDDLVAGKPVGRSESCPECDSDIRSCRACEYYDLPNRSCREPTGELPADHERGNFCSAYRLAMPAIDAAPAPKLDAAAEARKKLEALFSKKG